MNINDAFPSNFIKAMDLKGQAVKVKIDRVVYEEIGSDQKLVVYFQNRQKGLVLNKTNGMAIAADFGPETDSWIGGDVELFSMKVPFNGQQVDSVRVRTLASRQPSDVNVSANAKDRQTSPPVDAYDNGLDDEIPF